MRRAVMIAIAFPAVMALLQFTADDGMTRTPMTAEPSPLTESVPRGLAVERMESMPLAFTENKGQWDERVKFRANAGGATIWFTTDGIYYQFTRSIRLHGLTSDDPMQMPIERFNQEPDSIEQLVIKASFAGANADVAVFGEELMEYKCNYFIGNDPSKWHTEVPNFSSILHKDVYPGIDIRFFGAGGGKAGYEFIAEPGAELEQIKVQYEGTDGLSVDADGRLVAHTGWRNMVLAKGSGADETFSTSSGFLLSPESTASLDFVADESLQPASLVLTLDYSTYLGGSSEDQAFDIAVDGSGSAYLTGYTRSTDFPTLNPYQDTPASDTDVFVTKFSSTGNSPVFSTYLGGSLGEWGLSIALDESGLIYVTGWTHSDDFPIVSPYQDSLRGVEDVFVTKLSSTGNNLVYSTYLGGSGSDYGDAIAVDGSGSVHVTGETSSINDFPTVNAYQGSFQGGWWDVFVTKFSNSGNTLVYSTYLGGGDSDFGHGVAVDGFGAAYVAGSTYSTDFPILDPYQDTFQGGDQDGFVTKLSGSGSLVYSTYLGGSEADGVLDIAVYWLMYGNPPGFAACVTGGTLSADFPIINHYQTHQGNTDAFITKFSNTGSSLVYSTYIGGNGPDNGEAIAVDASGDMYVTGRTQSADFPTFNPYQTDQGLWDAFVAKLSSAGGSLVYSTYLGGSSDDYGKGIAVDSSGSAYVAGETESADFPTIDPYQTDQGDWDAFVTKLSFVEFACGDADGSGMVDIDDVVFLIAFIFSGGPEPVPYESGDADCSGDIDIDDVVYLIAHIFSGGNAPCDTDGDGAPDC